MTARTGAFAGSGAVATLGTYIPEIWAGSLLEKFYAATVFSEISNTDYEGEIKNMGDTVHVRIIPDITIRQYQIGQSLTYERPAVTKDELTIDKGYYWGFSCNDVEKKQSDIDYVSSWASDASEQLKITIDTEILAYLGEITSPIVATGNTGSTAGIISSSVNLGVSGTPFSLTKANVVDKIVECGQVLDEQNRPETGRWMVLPAWAISRIKKSDLKDASLTGDGKSILRNGRIGMIDRFTIYSSNNVYSVSGDSAWSGLFGDKNALTFASQILNSEMLRNPNDFGDLMRGLQVYGRKLIDSKGMGILYVSAGSES